MFVVFLLALLFLIYIKILVLLQHCSQYFQPLAYSRMCDEIITILSRFQLHEDWQSSQIRKEHIEDGVSAFFAALEISKVLFRN